MSVDLYDTEVIAVKAEWERLNAKYSSRQNTPENLANLKNEAEEAFYKLGFKAIVNVWNALKGEPPVIEIVERLNPNMDPDRISYEIRKTNERNETLPDIDQGPQ